MKAARYVMITAARGEAGVVLEELRSACAVKEPLRTGTDAGLSGTGLQLVAELELVLQPFRATEGTPMVHFRSLAPGETARWGHCAAALSNGSVAIFGGVGGPQHNRLSQSNI